MSCKDRKIEDEISGAEILFGNGQQRDAFDVVIEALRKQADLRYHYAETFIPRALEGKLAEEKIAEIKRIMKQGERSGE